MALLAWVAIPDAWLPALTLTLACMVLVLIWLWRARMNAEGMARQRRHRGWVIAGWFCPIVNLWFPVQIVDDIARADQPGPGRDNGALIRAAWWICWLLAWATGFYYRKTEFLTPDGGVSISWSAGITFGGTELSRIFAAAAAFLLALIVRQITSQQHRRLDSTITTA